MILVVAAFRSSGLWRVLITASGLVCFCAGAALAETVEDPKGRGSVIAVRAISANAEIRLDDLGFSGHAIPGALTAPAEAVGKEARTTIFAGRPILAGDLRPAAVVERNALVRLTYTTGFLSISADGRALDRGAPGDRVRAMNLTSRATISGTVMPDGSIEVSE